MICRRLMLVPQHRLELSIFLAQLAGLVRLAYEPIELLQADRLGEELAGAELHRLDRRFDRRLAGQHDHLALRMAALAVP